MKLYLLSTAYGSVPKGLFVSGAPWKTVRFPILSFNTQEIPRPTGTTVYALPRACGLPFGLRVAMYNFHPGF